MKEYEVTVKVAVYFDDKAPLHYTEVRGAKAGDEGAAIRTALSRERATIRAYQPDRKSFDIEVVGTKLAILG